MSKVKALLLFAVAPESFDIHVVGEDGVLDIFPAIAEEFVTIDMNQLKTLITKEFGSDAFKAFVGSAKPNFDLQPDETLTPGMWGAAVTSYRFGISGNALQWGTDEVPADPNASYLGAASFVNTFLTFAAYLSPEQFLVGGKPLNNADSVTAIQGLRPADPAKVVEAITAAQETPTAPEQVAEPVVETVTPVVATAPETVVAKEPVTAKDPVVEAPAKPINAPVVVAETEVTPASAAVFLEKIVEAFDTQETAVVEIEERLNALRQQIEAESKVSVAQIRKANKAVRDAILSGLIAASTPTLPEKVAEEVA